MFPWKHTAHTIRNHFACLIPAQCSRGGRDFSRDLPRESWHIVSSGRDGLAAFPGSRAAPSPALRATFSQEGEDQKCPNAFSLREKVPEGRMRVLLCDVPRLEPPKIR